MISASYQIFAARNKLLHTGHREGKSINAVLDAVKRDIRKHRIAVRKTGAKDPLINWDLLDIFVEKRGEAVKEKVEPINAE